MRIKLAGIIVCMLLVLGSLQVIGKYEKNDFDLSTNEIKNVFVKSTKSIYSSPIVVIEYPKEADRIYCLPDIYISGYGEDDHGVVTFNILHEYTGGQMLTILDLFGEYPHADFSMPITLHNGWNRITVTAYDIGGEHGEDSIIAHYNSAPDTTHPTLDIEYDRSIYFQPNIKVKFTATDNCGVIIHKIMHETSEGGQIACLDYINPWPIYLSFEWNFILKEGLNTITAYAVDIGGYEVVSSIDILYIKTKEIKTLNANFLEENSISYQFLDCQYCNPVISTNEKFLIKSVQFTQMQFDKKYRDSKPATIEAKVYTDKFLYHKGESVLFTAFTFLTIYKYLIRHFPFFEKILNQILI